MMCETLHTCSILCFLFKRNAWWIELSMMQLYPFIGNRLCEGRGMHIVLPHDRSPVAPSPQILGQFSMNDYCEIRVSGRKLIWLLKQISLASWYMNFIKIFHLLNRVFSVTYISTKQRSRKQFWCEAEAEPGVTASWWRTKFGWPLILFVGPLLFVLYLSVLEWEEEARGNWYENAV